MFNEVEKALSTQDGVKKIKVFFYARYGAEGIGGADIRFFSMLFQVGEEEIILSKSSNIGNGLLKTRDIKEMFTEFSNLMFKLTEKYQVTFIGDKMHAAWIDSVHQIAYCDRKPAPYKRADMENNCFMLCKYSDFTGFSKKQNHIIIDLPTLCEFYIMSNYYTLFRNIDSDTYSNLKELGQVSEDELLAVSKVKTLKEIYDQLKNNL